MWIVGQGGKGRGFRVERTYPVSFCNALTRTLSLRRLTSKRRRERRRVRPEREAQPVLAWLQRLMSRDSRCVSVCRESLPNEIMSKYNHFRLVISICTAGLQYHSA